MSPPPPLLELNRLLVSSPLWATNFAASIWSPLESSFLTNPIDSTVCERGHRHQFLNSSSKQLAVLGKPFWDLLPAERVATRGYRELKISRRKSGSQARQDEMGVDHNVLRGFRILLAISIALSLSFLKRPSLVELTITSFVIL